MSRSAPGPWRSGPPGDGCWCEIRPAVPDPGERRPAPPTDLTTALLAAAAGGGHLDLRIVAEPYRVAVVVPDGARTLRVLAARLPAAELVAIGDPFTCPRPPACASARLRGPVAMPVVAGREIRSPADAGVLLAAVAAASLTDGEAAEVRLRIRPAAGRGGGTAATAGSLLCGVAVGVLDTLLDTLLDVVGALASGASGASRASGASGAPGRYGLPGPRDREPVRLRGGPPPGVAEPAARVALSARWYGADPRAARDGLHAFAAAAGLRPARLARPVACTAAALACLVEVPAELDRRPVHLRPAVLRGGEPAGPSARGTIPLGRTRAGREFALAPADFAGHAYVLGPSGTGKTTLLGRLVNGLAAAGVAAVVLDPHGDLTREVLATLPPRDLARAAVFDLSDIRHLPVVNPLHVPAVGDRAEVAVARAVRAAAVSAMFSDLWGLERASAPNLLHFLHAALAALVAAGGCLSELPAFLTDPAYRAAVVRRGGDDRVRRRWQEFAALGRDDRSRTVRAILNKAAEFDRDDVVSTVFGEPGPGLSVPEVLDTGGLLLVHLPRGTVPEGSVALVGSLFITLLHQAALARESRPAAERPLAVAVIDEFQEFALRAFAQVVTATRKYGLGLVVANQNLSRIRALSPDVLSTLLNNVATLATFRPGADDAAALATQFSPLSASSLLAMPPRSCCWRLAGGGAPRTLVTATALPPPAPRRTDAEVAALLADLRLRVPHRSVRPASAAGGRHETGAADEPGGGDDAW